MNILSFGKRPLPLLCAVLLLGVSAPSHADWVGKLFDDQEARVQAWSQSPDQRLRLGELEYVQLVARSGAEAGTPNQHPAQLRSEELAAALAAIQVRERDKVLPLFSEEEVATLASTASIALAKAKPDQDLNFLVSGRHEAFGFVTQKLAASGRIFFVGDRLNVIVGKQLSEALLGRRPGTRPAENLGPGSRAKASPGVEVVGLSQGEAEIRRADWIAITLKPVAAKPAATNAQPATAAPAAAAATAGAVVAAPRAAEGQAGVIDPSVEKHFNKQESRLRLLQRMRDQGLISEQEYQQKRAEALKEL